MEEPIVENDDPLVHIEDLDAKLTNDKLEEVFVDPEIEILQTVEKEEVPEVEEPIIEYDEISEEILDDIRDDLEIEVGQVVEKEEDPVMDEPIIGNDVKSAENFDDIIDEIIENDKSAEDEPNI